MEKAEFMDLFKRLDMLDNDEFLSLVTVCITACRESKEGFIMACELLKDVIAVTSIDIASSNRSFEGTAEILIDAACQDIKERMLDPITMTKAKHAISIREEE